MVACRVLERDEGIHCNITLVFSLVQAILAAEVGATIISPFVGRTTDWWHKNHAGKDYTGMKNPGVRLVKEICYYYSECGSKHQPEVMAAALRSVDECIHLAGVSRMTCGLHLVAEMEKADYCVPRAALRARFNSSGELQFSLSLLKFRL